MLKKFETFYFDEYDQAVDVVCTLNNNGIDEVFTKSVSGELVPFDCGEDLLETFLNDYKKGEYNEL